MTPFKLDGSFTNLFQPITLIEAIRSTERNWFKINFNWGCAFLKTLDLNNGVHFQVFLDTSDLAIIVNWNLNVVTYIGVGLRGKFVI